MTPEEYREKIQNPATRTQDVGIRISASKQALTSFDNYEDRWSAFCVLGYALMSSEAPASEDIDFFLRSKDEIMYSLENSEKRPIWFRWYTSANLCLGYFHMHSGQLDDAVYRLNTVINSSNHIALWPAQTTNHIAARLYLGLLQKAAGELKEAGETWRSSGDFFKFGVAKINLANYWDAFDLRGGVAFLLESTNEMLILDGQPQQHRRGSLLWGIYQKIFLKIIA